MEPEKMEVEEENLAKRNREKFTESEHESFKNLVATFQKSPSPVRKKFKAMMTMINELTSGSSGGDESMETDQDQVDDRLWTWWQWSETTGDAIFPNPLTPWERYVPEFFIPADVNEASRKILQSFVAGMQSNQERFDVVVIKNILIKDEVHARERTFLRRILAKYIKKVQISRQMGPKKITYTITKMSYALRPYSELNLDEFVGNRAQASVFKTMEMINEQAQFSDLGPGTFHCMGSEGARVCGNREIVTKSAIVDYGRQHKFTLTKRFHCGMKNVVYMLHCDECKKNGTYANHVGFSHSLHDRLNSHFHPSSSNAVLPEPLTLETKAELIRAAQDPYEFRRDSHVHFSIEHTFDKTCEECESICICSRKFARITILHKLPTDDNLPSYGHFYPGKQQLEEMSKQAAGSYLYLGQGRGGLNKPGCC